MRAAKDTVALVTGAGSGIGRATATELALWGAHVTLLVRDASGGETTKNEILARAPYARVEVLVADLASHASIRRAAHEFLQKHPELHVLVNAAGVFLPAREVTEDGLEKTFATNYVAYFLLTNLLTPALEKGAPSRVVNVSSRYGGAKIDFEDPNFEKRTYSYLKSTPPTMVARVLFTQEYARRMSGKGIVANAVHPGLVANTQLLSQTRGFFRWLTNTLGSTPEKGADTVVWLATAPEAGDVTGKLWRKRRTLRTPGQGSDPAARTRLWEMTETLVARSDGAPKAAIAR